MMLVSLLETMGKFFVTISSFDGNGQPSLLVYCLYEMLPLDNKRTTSSSAPPLFYVTKNLAIKRWKVPHLRIQFAMVVILNFNLKVLPCPTEAILPRVLFCLY